MDAVASRWSLSATAQVLRPRSALSPESPPTWDFRRWWPYLALLLLVEALYVRCLRFNFVDYDDVWLVLWNQKLLGNLKNIGQLFLKRSWDVAHHSTAGLYYRPTFMLSLML